MRPRTTNAAGRIRRPGGASAVSEHPESQAHPSAGAEQQRDEDLELLRRARADFENAQKRSRRALAQERREALATE